MRKEKSILERLDKENFIDFLASATPSDLNELIKQKGKPPKLWSQIYFFRYPEQQNQDGGNNNEQSG